MLTKYQQFFTGRPTVEIAKDLLGKLVKYQTTNGIIGGYIVETEAYLGEKILHRMPLTDDALATRNLCMGCPGIFTYTKSVDIIVLILWFRMQKNLKEFYFAE